MLVTVSFNELFHSGLTLHGAGSFEESVGKEEFIILCAALRFFFTSLLAALDEMLQCPHYTIMNNVCVSMTLPPLVSDVIVPWASRK